MTIFIIITYLLIGFALNILCIIHVSKQISILDLFFCAVLSFFGPIAALAIWAAKLDKIILWRKKP